jgi:hypothetical protein
MGKTLFISNVDYSENAINVPDAVVSVSYNNREIRDMIKPSAINYYIADTGQVKSNSQLCYVMIDLTDIKRIAISGHSGPTTGGFFSSINASTSTKISVVTQKGDSELSNKMLTVPSNAKYFGFNIWTGYENYAVIKYLK